MRRPLVLLFLCFAAGCFFGWYSHWKFSFFWVLALFLLAGAEGVLYWKKAVITTPVVLVFLAFLAGLISMEVELNRQEPLLHHLGEEVSLLGEVVREKDSDYGRSLLVRPISEDPSLGDLLSRRRIWVYVDGKDLDGDDPVEESWCGWKILFKGVAEQPAAPKNPGGFDQKTYLRTLGAQVVMDVPWEDCRVVEQQTAWNARLRTMLSSRWEPIMGSRSCGGLMGLLFGVSDDMDEETLDAFQTIGLGHLLAVSGLHVGLVYGAVQKLLGNGKRSTWVQILCMCSVIFYAALAGFSASATRAAMMITIHGIGQICHRPYDMVTSASAAGMVILTCQPCQLFSGGFQLSMIAAFGLACVLPRVQFAGGVFADRKRREILRWAVDKGSGLVAIQLVMGPICGWKFHCFSFWSLVLNPLCIAVAGMLIPMAMGLAILTFFMDFLGPVFPLGCSLTGALMTGIMNLGEWAAQLPGTFLTGGLPPGAMALYYCGLFTWASEDFYILLRKGKRKQAALWICTVVLGCHMIPWGMGMTTSPTLLSRQEYPVVFLDVGQGDCVHIETPGGKHILIDGGGSSWKNVGKDTLLPYLLHRGGTKVDLALATHLHQDHFQGIRELAGEIPVKQLGIYEANLLREEEVKGMFGPENPPELIYLKEGSRITLEQDVWIDVLAPPQRSAEEYEDLIRDDSDENDSCLIFLVHYQGLTILITGDMGMEGEEELLQRSVSLSADILKVGHHGSKYSTSEAFLQAVDPQMAVISVGRNYFGHPSDRVIELLEKNDIMVGRTDQQGAVIVTKIHGDQAWIKSGNGEYTWPIDLPEQ